MLHGSALGPVTAWRCRFTSTALATVLAAIGGATWLAGGKSLAGPLLSLLLPVATAISPSRLGAWIAALAYYGVGSVSIVGAVTGYHGAEHVLVGLLAWIGASVALALPWMFGRSPWGRLFALVATAVPPLGVMGWLSPLNAAGALFPAMNWAGVACIALFTAVPWDGRCWRRPGRTLLALAILAGMSNLSQATRATASPTGWIGLQTQIPPARGNLMQTIANDQALIDAALNTVYAQKQHVDVVVFPEAVLDDWWPGTQQQFAAAVPPGQTWLIGAQMTSMPEYDGKPINAVVAVQQGQAGQAQPHGLTAAAGLLLGGNWTPWNDGGLQPAVLQRTFDVHGQRVWASLCAEQLQPWTWLMAMHARPTLVLAMSNVWWTSSDSFAPLIQIASTRAWARLMNVPVILARNGAPSSATQTTKYPNIRNTP